MKRLISLFLLICLPVFVYSASKGFYSVRFSTYISNTVIYFIPNSTDEANYIDDTDGSQISGSARYADGNNYFIYKIDLFAKGINNGMAVLELGNNFIVKASSDNKATWVEVLNSFKINGTDEHNELNKAEYGFEIKPFCRGQQYLYIMIGDQSPSDGWGGKLYSLRVLKNPVVKNGKTIIIDIDAGSPSSYTYKADFSALDSTYIPGSETVSNLSAQNTRIYYTISPINTNKNNSSIPIYIICSNFFSTNRLFVNLFNPENVDVNFANFKAVGSWGEGIKLTWNLVGNDVFESYNIYRNNSGPLNELNKGILITNTVSVDLQYIDNTAQNGKTYYYGIEGVLFGTNIRYTSTINSLNVKIAGGEFYGLNDGIKIKIPDFAISKEFTISFSDRIQSGLNFYNNPELSQSQLVYAYSVAPYSAAFNNLLNFEIYYTNDLYDDQEISIYAYNEQYWYPVSAFKDSSIAGGGKISFSANHLGLFGIFQQSVNDTDESFPSQPFSPNNDNLFSYAEFKFYNKQNSNIKIEIFDLNNKRIKILCDGEIAAGPVEFRWDGTDLYGQIVSIGPYIFQIKINNKVYKNGVVVVVK